MGVTLKTNQWIGKESKTIYLVHEIFDYKYNTQPLLRVRIFFDRESRNFKSVLRRMRKLERRFMKGKAIASLEGFQRKAQLASSDFADFLCRLTFLGENPLPD
jgi:hypothetical protein